MSLAAIYYKKILEIKHQHRNSPQYAGWFFPVIEFYKGLSGSDQLRAFEEAIEMLLTSKIKDQRAFAIKVCLGCITFRDAL